MIKITKNTIGKALLNFKSIITGIELNKSVANVAMGDIIKHFRNEQDPDGKKWPALAEVTKERRRHGKGSASLKMLQDTGQLLQSINISQTTASAAVVSLNKYDAYFGINVAQLQNDGGKGKILEEDGSVTEINVPAREFMGISDLGKMEIEALALIVAKKVAVK